MLLCLFCLLTVLLATGKGQSQSPRTAMEFDCRRPGVGCGDPINATLCLFNGTCDCTTSSLKGYDCTLDTTEVVETQCTACSKNGTCLKNSNQPCKCDEGYYGQQCENMRAQLWCNGQEMAININPYGTENYTLFVSAVGQDNSEKEDCILTKITKPEDYSNTDYIKNASQITPDLKGYFIRLNHTRGPCGNANVTTADNNSRTDYIRKVVVAYDHYIVSSLDHLITLNCSMQNNNTYQIVSGTSVSVAEEDYTPVDVVKTFQPVIFQVTDGNDKLLTNTVVLGQVIKLAFTMADNSNYTSFKVTSCAAANGNSNTSLTFNLLQDDCPTPQSKLVAMEGPRTASVTGASGVLKKVTFSLHAFKFKGTSDQVIFSCTCTMCRDTDASCTEKSCGTTAPASGGSETTTATATTSQEAETTATATTEATTTPPGRRKRSATQPDQREVSSSIRVVGAAGTASAQESTVSTGEECMDRSQVVTIIVIFSVAVLILLVIIVAMVVGVYLSRRRFSRKVGFEESTSLYTLPRLSVAHDKPA